MKMSCGMPVKRVGMLRVNVKKTKALNVKMETATLTGTGTKNLTCLAH